MALSRVSQDRFKQGHQVRPVSLWDRVAEQDHLLAVERPSEGPVSVLVAAFLVVP